MTQLQSGDQGGRDVRILSIDGGGIRGILPARLLQEIERRTNKKTTDLFHLVAGTSTGGIIGCGLAIGMAAKDMGDLYAQKGGDIFARSMWQRISNPAQLTGAKYSADTLEQILSGILRTETLRDIASTELLVPTYAIQLSKPVNSFGVQSTRTPMFFKSWKAGGRGLAPGERANDFNFALKDVARATSAAPTYFPPAQIENTSGDKFGVVDGGVFANNPALCALSAAYNLYNNCTFTLISLGTGSLERNIPYEDAKDWGEIQWIHPILSILMDGNADTVTYQCAQVLGPKHHRFETTLGTDPKIPTSVNDDFDDALPDNVARLEALAKKLINDNTAKLDQVCELLLV